MSSHTRDERNACASAVPHDPGGEEGEVGPTRRVPPEVGGEPRRLEAIGRRLHGLPGRCSCALHDERRSQGGNGRNAFETGSQGTAQTLRMPSPGAPRSLSQNGYGNRIWCMWARCGLRGFACVCAADGPLERRPACGQPPTAGTDAQVACTLLLTPK